MTVWRSHEKDGRMIRLGPNTAWECGNTFRPAQCTVRCRERKGKTSEAIHGVC